MAGICTRQGILKTGEALREAASKVRAQLCSNWGVNGIRGNPVFSQLTFALMSLALVR